MRPLFSKSPKARRTVTLLILKRRQSSCSLSIRKLFSSFRFRISSARAATRRARAVIFLFLINTVVLSYRGVGRTRQFLIFLTLIAVLEAKRGKGFVNYLR